MKRWFNQMLVLLVLMAILCGCSSQNNETEGIEGTVEDMFAQTTTVAVDESETGETETSADPMADLRGKSTQFTIYGSKLYHFEFEDGRRYLTYAGGEMTVECSLQFILRDNTVPDEAGVGLWVLVDGIPQPFRLNDGDEYSYMHMIFPEPDVKEMYRFSFTPVVGEMGEEKSLMVGCVAAPQYMPGKGAAYNANGISQIFTKAMLRYGASSPGSDEPYTQLLSDVVITNQEVTVEERDDFLHHLSFPTDENGAPDIVGNEFDVRYIVYVDDTESFGSTRKSRYALEEKEKVKLKVECMLGLDIPYRCIVYLDNEPVGWTDMMERNSSCELTTIEMTLDVSGIKDRANLRVVLVAVDPGAPDLWGTLSPRLLLYR